MQVHLEKSVRPLLPRVHCVNAGNILVHGHEQSDLVLLSTTLQLLAPSLVQHGNGKLLLELKSFSLKKSGSLESELQ